MTAKKNLLTQLAEIGDGKLPENFDWDDQEHDLAPLETLIAAEPTAKQAQQLELMDEGLRDALGRVKLIPDFNKACAYIDSVYDFGIRSSVFAMGAPAGSAPDVLAGKILKEATKRWPEWEPTFGISTRMEELEAVHNYQKINPKVQAAIFRGTSPLRMFAENWSFSLIEEDLKKSFGKANEYKIPIFGVIEHTTQSNPDLLQKIIKIMVESGQNSLKSIMITDTAGTVGPRGTQRITKFIQKQLNLLKADEVAVQMHGHNDRGLAISNGLIAIANGATSMAVTPWGDGERAGNASLEALCGNLYLIAKKGNLTLNWEPKKLAAIGLTYAAMIGEEIPIAGPLAANAFSTSYGTHLAAEYKIGEIAEYLEKLNKQLQDIKGTIYTPWGPETWGRKTQVVVAANTGLKGIMLKSKSDLGIIIDEKQAGEIYQLSCKNPKPLTNEEFAVLVDQVIK